VTVLIGELADAAGLTSQAIRFYERKGLLPDPERGSNRYRNYDVLAAIVAERPEIVLTRRAVETPEEAQTLGFHGSPSILVDGVDVFAGPDAGVGLSCRVCDTADGAAGSPTTAQLRAALGAPEAGV
jgi:hypothetical protein